MKIAILVGSLRKASYNMILAKFLAKKYSEDHDFKILNMDLPLFNEDLESDKPQNVLDFLRELEEADAYILVSPEYNHSVSSVTKNALDWASRGTSMRYKPAFLLGASSGKYGTTRGQEVIRKTLNLMQIYAIAGNEVLIGPAEDVFKDGELKDERTISYIDKTFKKFLEWSDKVK